jgi:hypothetical protein
MKKFGISLPLVFCGALALLGFSGPQAHADTIYTLSSGNGALTGANLFGPYGTVDVSLDSTKTIATITLTSGVVGDNIYMFGSKDMIGVNVNASSWTVGAITGTNSGTNFTVGPLTVGSSGNEDGFGSFNQQISDFDGFSHSVTSLSFTLTNTGGTWSSDANVLTTNSGGYHVGVHVYPSPNPPDGGNNPLGVNTGFAADGSTVVPEPSSIALGAIGLFGLGLTQIRRLVRRKALAMA